MNESNMIICPRCEISSILVTFETILGPEIYFTGFRTTGLDSFECQHCHFIVTGSQVWQLEERVRNERKQQK